MANRLKRFLRHLPALLGVGLLCGAIFVVQREFRSLKLADIEVALAAIPHRALGISFLWTLLSYFILTFYDRLGTIYAGHKVSYGRVAFASFAPTRCRIIWGLPRFPVPPCATACMPIGG